MLKLEALRITFGDTALLRGLDLEIKQGETHGLVGESGSGKSIAALAIMGLLPPGLMASGRVMLGAENLLALEESAMARRRGRAIAMVFQEPMSALNPVHRVGRQIAEGMVQHSLRDSRAAMLEAARLLEHVGLGAERASAYPHHLSGGQRQRVLIAMAMAMAPQVLIADEPTSALDASLQGAVLDLLADLARERAMAMLLISHDLGVIAQRTQSLTVLYGGAVMESGATEAILARPRHPYTQGLLGALPRGKARGARLSPIPGQVPAPPDLAPGCPFHGRCPRGDARCRSTAPPLQHGAFCFYPEDA